MIDWNQITSYPAFIAAMPICYAYLRVAVTRTEIERVRHMAVSLFLFAGCFAWRTLFWDVLPFWFGEDWPAFYQAIGRTTINAVWNIAFLYACIRALQALHLMVPEEDRRKWPVWRAWLYPPWRHRRMRSED